MCLFFYTAARDTNSRMSGHFGSSRHYSALWSSKPRERWVEVWQQNTRRTTIVLDTFCRVIPNEDTSKTRSGHRNNFRIPTGQNRDQEEEWTEAFCTSPTPGYTHLIIRSLPGYPALPSIYERLWALNCYEAIRLRVWIHHAIGIEDHMENAILNLPSVRWIINIS